MGGTGGGRGLVGLLSFRQVGAHVQGRTKARATALGRGDRPAFFSYAVCAHASGVGRGVAVLDPGPLIVNANSFTWRGHGNPALAEPPD